MDKKTWSTRLAGAAAGLANGLFGGGGGMVFLPLMSRGSSLALLSVLALLSALALFATCVGVIFPVCLVSAGIYLFRAGISLLTALPYLLGGLFGGFLGGRAYGRVPTVWLRRLFALFLFYAGVKYLL